MKHMYKYMLALLLGVAVVYTACKKSQITSVPTKTSTAELSRQIALSLYKALAGKYGGPAVNGGVKVLTHRGLSVNTLNALCGYAVDTAYNYDVNGGLDTVRTYTGHFGFTYQCDINSVVNGYVSTNSIAYREHGVLFDNNSSAVQDYTVSVLNPNFLVFSLGGHINVSTFNYVLNAHGDTTQYHNLISDYVLTAVHVDYTGATGDITSGSATFSTTNAYLDPYAPLGSSSEYNGSMTFEGSNNVLIVIDLGGGDHNSFRVNMITGVVTPVP